MKKEIQVLGLGIDQGQGYLGLRKSHEFLESFFPALRSVGVDIRPAGLIEGSQEVCPKIFSQSELSLMDWTPYREAYLTIRSLLRDPQLLLNWGGDHSVGLSTVGAFSETYPDGKVLWIDAHADLNCPESSPSGHFHGMPVAVLMNLENLQQTHFPWLQGRLKPENLIYLGLRDLDPFEGETIQRLGIHHYTMKDVRRLGIGRVAAEILKATRGSELHVSFDIDSVSPEFAPATGVPVNEGFNLSELRYLGQNLARHSGLKSLDVVEINPALGSESEVLRTYLAALHFLIPLLRPGTGAGITESPQGSLVFESSHMLLS